MWTLQQTPELSGHVIKQPFSQWLSRDLKLTGSSNVALQIGAKSTKQTKVQIVSSPGTLQIIKLNTIMLCTHTKKIPGHHLKNPFFTSSSMCIYRQWTPKGQATRERPQCLRIPSTQESVSHGLFFWLTLVRLFSST